MKANNFTERKKRIIAFAGLYAASIILLLFILSAFGMRFSDNEQSNNLITINDAPAPATPEILRADSLLHTELQELQLADMRYNLQADSGGTSQRTNAFMATLNASAALKKSLDSIQQITKDYAGDDRIMYTTMLTTFKSVLNDRQVKKTQQPANGSKNLFSNGLDDMQWTSVMQMKESEINRLQAEIKSLQERDMLPTKTGAASEAQKGENELLKTAFSEQQKDYDALKESYKRLKNENTQLATQLVEVRKAPALQPEKSNTADNKIAMLEQKLEAMNADLYFAKIDCNLARTDAQQMISNARQRKELLSESLVMLNSLSKSDDAEIQKKAKEKIVRLNRIATVLHD